MINPKPIDPAFVSTPLGETKIPEPIITPTIIPTPSTNPNSFFNLIPSDEPDLEDMFFNIVAVWQTTAFLNPACSPELIAVVQGQAICTTASPTADCSLATRLPSQSYFQSVSTFNRPICLNSLLPVSHRASPPPSSQLNNTVPSRS